MSLKHGICLQYLFVHTGYIIYRSIQLLVFAIVLFLCMNICSKTHQIASFKTFSPVVACQRYVCPSVISMTMNVIIQECIIKNCFIKPYV